MPVVYLVIPCYNEEAVLPETNRRLTEKMRTMMQAGLADEKISTGILRLGKRAVDPGHVKTGK